MGDEGKLYVPPELVSVYREKVVPVASMLTPNQFEAEQLTGFRIVSEQDGREACNIIHAAGPTKVVITSINIDNNLFLIGSHQKGKGQSSSQFRIVIPKIPAYFTGTGDLMTALLLGWSNKYPDDLDKAAELAVSSLQALLARTLKDYERVGYDPQSSSLEIRLIQSQDDLRNPEMFTAGPAFKGIKMIPPGPHFIYYSSSSRVGNEFSPVIGFFIYTSPAEVIVRKWDQLEEQLVRLSEEEEERYSQAVKSLEFDRQLGPYTLSQFQDWKRLSSYITESVIKSIEPIGGDITVACEPEMIGKFSGTSTEKALAEQLKNSRLSGPADKPKKRSCYYTSIPRVIKHKGLSGQELTSLNLDKTQLLESLLVKEYEGSEDLMLAELQFGFVAFLMGQSLEAFLQWKSLVSLLLGCTQAPLHTRSQLFTKFIKVIYYQLKYGFCQDPSDTGTAAKGVFTLLDETSLSADSFLHHLCKDFFSLVLEAPVVDGDLLSWTRKFKQLLEDSLGWHFQQNSTVDGIDFDEGDEFAPVVEMLDPGQ
ncbi:hypothetical protein RJ639_018891 [Escallonia herrerae]|uniref:Pyridoxal kinase n=1 Tax=Escallonia herrerae TaxID=1293975 RepID=A0AA88V8F0_9ASTE|nr:hypothetical protein RJ639_018891 [Escallonia herrerae]